LAKYQDARGFNLSETKETKAKVRRRRCVGGGWDGKEEGGKEGKGSVLVAKVVVVELSPFPLLTSISPVVLPILLPYHVVIIIVISC